VQAVGTITAILTQIDSHISSQISQAQKIAQGCLDRCDGCCSRQIEQASALVGKCCTKIQDQINAILSEAQARALSTQGGQQYLASQQAAELAAAGVPTPLAGPAAGIVSTVPIPPNVGVSAPGGIDAGNIGQLASALAIALYPLATAIGQLAQAASGIPVQTGGAGAGFGGGPPGIGGAGEAAGPQQFPGTGGPPTIPQLPPFPLGGYPTQPVAGLPQQTATSPGEQTPTPAAGGQPAPTEQPPPPQPLPQPPQCVPVLRYALDEYQWIDGPTRYVYWVELQLDPSVCPPSPLSAIPEIVEEE
jgi:hypothetical protein